MGMFSKFGKMLKSSNDDSNRKQPIIKQPRISVEKKQPIDRREISAKTIDDMQKVPASISYQREVCRLYYKDFPIKPFISMDREENTNRMEMARTFPNTALLKKEDVTPFDDGLLPGHIYMMYWIIHNSQKDRRVPSYFEYRYGIQFDKEKQFLIENGYLKEDHLTEKGEEAIKNHYAVIEAHSPEKTSAEKAKKEFADKKPVTVKQEEGHPNFHFTSATGKRGGADIKLVSSFDYDVILEDVNVLNKLLRKIKEDDRKS